MNHADMRKLNNGTPITRYYSANTTNTAPVMDGTSVEGTCI